MTWWLPHVPRSAPGRPAPGSVNRASKWRGANDFYPTPKGAIVALRDLGILPERVWEPACGNGAISKVLELSGHAVVSTDLCDYGFGEAGVDFLLEPRLRAPAIVTNPPFHIANEFVDHALRMDPEIACFFLRLKFLEGRRRYEMLMKNRPPAEVHVFIERVKFFSGDHAEAEQPGWNTEAFAWFVWRRGVVSSPRIHWISRGAS